eukprot:scaffold114785_cov75-Phaeocystis_antarctica.AAC.2
MEHVRPLVARKVAALHVERVIATKGVVAHGRVLEPLFEARLAELAAVTAVGPGGLRVQSYETALRVLAHHMLARAVLSHVEPTAPIANLFFWCRECAVLFQLLAQRVNPRFRDVHDHRLFACPILDAHQRVSFAAAAGRVPVEDSPLAVRLGIRAAARYVAVCPDVHHLDQVPKREHWDVRGLLYRGKALVLCRIALVVGAACAPPRLLTHASIEGPAGLGRRSVGRRHRQRDGGLHIRPLHGHACGGHG